MANNAAIEQQYRHFEPELANQLGIGVDIDYGNPGQRMRSLELGQLLQHLITEPTTLAADHHEPGGNHYLRWGANPMAPVGRDLEALTCLAMSSTVVGGTSPTAVTW